MTRIRSFWRAAVLTPLLALALVAGLAPQTFAQTTLNSTTTTAAVDTSQTVIPLTAVTNIAVGDTAVIDGEAMAISAVDTTALTITVRRGTSGTSAGTFRISGRGHVSGAVVWTGPNRRFYLDEPAGSCTASSEAFLPHIVLTSGNYYDCKNGEWVITRTRGYRDQTWGRSDGGTTYTASGAITIQPGVTFINGTTLAMTLANPTTEQNGTIMIILSTNASAHTVTYTAGFGGGTTARDVATFGGAVNDGFVIVAFNGVWWTISTRNVTFG